MTIDEAFDRLAERLAEMVYGYDNDEFFEGHRSSTRQSTIDDFAAELAPLKAVVEAAQHAMSHGHCDEGRFGWIADVKPLDAALASLLEGKEREG